MISLLLLGLFSARAVADTPAPHVSFERLLFDDDDLSLDVSSGKLAWILEDQLRDLGVAVTLPDRPPVLLAPPAVAADLELSGVVLSQRWAPYGSGAQVTVKVRWHLRHVRSGAEIFVGPSSGTGYASALDMVLNAADPRVSALKAAVQALVGVRQFQERTEAAFYAAADPAVYDEATRWRCEGGPRRDPKSPPDPRSAVIAVRAGEHSWPAALLNEQGLVVVPTRDLSAGQAVSVVLGSVTLAGEVKRLGTDRAVALVAAPIARSPCLAAAESAGEGALLRLYAPGQGPWLAQTKTAGDTMSLDVPVPAAVAVTEANTLAGLVDGAGVFTPASVLRTQLLLTEPTLPQAYVAPESE